MDTSVQRKKILLDLLDARTGVGAASSVTALACVWLRLSPGIEVWPLAMLMSAIVVAHAVGPLAKTRAAEAPVLRALGASDDAAPLFALVEGGALGGLAGLAAVALGPSLGVSLVWLAASAAAGAFSGLIIARHTLYTAAR